MVVMIKVAPRVLMVVAWFASTGCAATAGYTQSESNYWAAFTEVINGPLNAGINELPAPVREAHCYRVILASQGEGAPLLRFRGEMDSDSVGFPIIPINIRGNQPQNGTIAVFGFCSQGSGTIQLQANLPGPGHGLMLEAAFGSLDPSHGPDVVAVRQWFVRRQQEEAQRQAQQAREERAAFAQHFAQRVGPDLRGRLSAVAQQRGRYANHILDEVRAAQDVQEAFVLEPGYCYFFGTLPYENTEIQSEVQFTVVRNAAERADIEGAITYNVCIAPSGPVQEVSFRVRSRVPPNSPNPPTFAVLISNRAGYSVERRAADLEWIRTDPEARIQK